MKNNDKLETSFRASVTLLRKLYREFKDLVSLDSLYDVSENETYKEVYTFLEDIEKSRVFKEWVLLHRIKKLSYKIAFSSKEEFETKEQLKQMLKEYNEILSS